VTGVESYRCSYKHAIFRCMVRVSSFGIVEDGSMCLFGRGILGNALRKTVPLWSSVYFCDFKCIYLSVGYLLFAFTWFCQDSRLIPGVTRFKGFNFGIYENLQ
jgi:hypothetical protein